MKVDVFERLLDSALGQLGHHIAELKKVDILYKEIFYCSTSIDETIAGIEKEKITMKFTFLLEGGEALNGCRQHINTLYEQHDHLNNSLRIGEKVLMINKVYEQLVVFADEMGQHMIRAVSVPTLE
jgi:hypothetical protein